jgi:hypothetical protein
VGNEIPTLYGLITNVTAAQHRLGRGSAARGNPSLPRFAGPGSAHQPTTIMSATKSRTGKIAPKKGPRPSRAQQHRQSGTRVSPVRFKKEASPNQLAASTRRVEVRRRRKRTEAGSPTNGPRPSRAQPRRQSPPARNHQKPPTASPLSPPLPVAPNQPQSTPINPSPERGSVTHKH